LLFDNRIVSIGRMASGLAMRTDCVTAAAIAVSASPGVNSPAVLLYRFRTHDRLFRLTPGQIAAGKWTGIDP
jgi:hypothetical protein